MIKINLLLARKEKKKIGIQKEFIVSIFSIVFLALVFGLIHWRIHQDKEDTLTRITTTKKEIAYYKSLTTEVAKAKEAQKILQDKLNVINALRREKSGPAKVLDEVSTQKPEKIQTDNNTLRGKTSKRNPFFK